MLTVATNITSLNSHHSAERSVSLPHFTEEETKTQVLAQNCTCIELQCWDLNVKCQLSVGLTQKCTYFEKCRICLRNTVTDISNDDPKAKAGLPLSIQLYKLLI